MSRIISTISLFALAACGAVENGALIPAAPEMVPANPESDPVEASDVAEAVADMTANVTAANASGTRVAKPRGQRLKVFDDPKFKQRFIESYLSETEIEPTVNEEERDVMVQVIELVNTEQLVQAADLIKTSRTPESSAVLDFTLGNILYQQELLSEAADAYEVAIQKHAKFRRAWGNLGQIRFKLDELGPAVTAFTRVIELGGADPLTYGLLGVAHSRQDDNIAAEQAFRAAMMLDPGTQDWKMGLAETLFKQQRYADAAALFGNLVLAEPDRADLWLAQGEIFAQLGRLDAAAQNFEMVDQLGGSTVTSLQNLGDIYSKQERFGLAVDAYLRVLALSPDAKLDRMIVSAKYLSANGALDETKSLIDGIEKLRGDSLETHQRTDLYKLRVRIAAAEGASDEEARVLEEIVDLDPLDGEAIILLARHRARTDQPEKAIMLFDRAARIEKFEGEAKMRHGELLVQRGEYAKALPLLRRANELNPREFLTNYIEQVQRANKQGK